MQFKKILIWNKNELRRNINVMLNMFKQLSKLMRKAQNKKKK